MNCTICNQKFDTTFKLSRHVKQAHNINYLAYYANNLSKEPLKGRCKKCKRTR